MVGLGGGVGRARALAVGLSCYLVIFCMYVFRGFRPALGVGGAVLRWPWMGLRDFCPVCVGWCGRGLLCVGFALCILVSILFGRMVVA